MKVVVKVGGSLTFSDNGPKVSYFKKLIPILRKIKQKYQLIVVIGGGRFVENYVKGFSLSKKETELIFIELLRANVRLISFLLDMKPIFDLNCVKKNTTGVVGGIVPGRSTDANAAICAYKINADVLIKLTDVDGIYEKDPKRHKARKIDFIHYDKLKPKKKTRPKDYGILDPLAIKTIKKGKIKTYVINGKQPTNILKVLNGEKIGTLIWERK